MSAPSESVEDTYSIRLESQFCIAPGSSFHVNVDINGVNGGEVTLSNPNGSTARVSWSTMTNPNRVSSPSRSYTHNRVTTPKPQLTPAVMSVPGDTGTMTAANPAITTIASLDMDMSSRTLIARVTGKSPIRSWANGNGSLFSIRILDKSGVDIRGTFFTEAVNEFYDVLEVGKVYRFSGGNLKRLKPKFTTAYKSRFEIKFDERNTVIQLCHDEANIPKQKYDFCKIADVENKNKGEYIDVVGIVTDVGKIVHYFNKTTRNDHTRCDITIVDESGWAITVTLWDENADKAPEEYGGNPVVVALRAACVKEYRNCKNLSAGDCIDLYPEIPETSKLLLWWKRTGSTATVQSLSSTSTGGSKKRDRVSEPASIARKKSKRS